MRSHASRIVAIGALLCACDGSSDRTASTPRDSGLYAPPDDDELANLPPDEAFVTLTMPAFRELKVIDVAVDGGTYSAYDLGVTTLLSDVRVCVKQVRPLGGLWDDFLDWDDAHPERERPCHHTSEADGSDVVLEGVPALTELLVVAEKDGYHPSVIPVVVPAYDASSTVSSPFRMLRLDDPWPDVGVPVQPERGLVGLDVRTQPRSSVNDFLAGARLTIDPSAGDGPFYGRGGVFDLTAERTSGDVPDPSLATFNERSLRPRNVVVNLPKGEYKLVVKHEHATCRALGRFGGLAVFGFPTTEPNTISFPILDGHFTPDVSQLCECAFDPSQGEPSPDTCLPPDAGAL